MTVALPHQRPPVDFRIVDLFAGPGGLDMAATILGVPSVGIEWDANAVATRTAAGLHTVHGDVRAYGPKDFPEANVLAGGPPCQSFTVAGSGAGRRALKELFDYAQRLVDREARADIDAALEGMDDERTGLVLEPLRWVLSAIDDPELRPYDAIVLEQVPAAIRVWEEYAKVLDKEGYSVDYDVLHTEAYGVPQTRRRAILVARRNPQKVALPDPTHHRYRKGAPRPESDLVFQSWVAMEDVLTERTLPFQVVSNYGTGGDPKLRGRRRSCEPSATVTGKVSRNRIVTDDATERDLPRLSHSEAGRLQTFPKRFPWSGGDIAQQIGNAVPPRLGIHVLGAALGRPLPGEDEWCALADWAPKARDEDEADASH